MQHNGDSEHDPQIDAYIEGYCSGKGITSKELAGDGDHFSIVYDAAAKHAYENPVTTKIPASSPPDTDREVLFSNGKAVYMGVYDTLSSGNYSDKPKGFIDGASYDKDFGYEDFIENVIWWMELPDPK